MHFPDKENFFEAGVLVKTHGLHGSILISLHPGHFFHFNEGNALFIDIDGLIVPFIIEEIDFSGTHNAFVFIRHYRSLNAAKMLVGKTFWLEKSILEVKTSKKTNNRPDTLIDYLAYDKNYGLLGKVVNVIDSKQLILVINFNDKEVMFPLVEQTVDHIDHQKREIHLLAPEGLIDFYLND